MRKAIKILFLTVWTALLLSSGFLEVAFIASLAFWAFEGKWDWCLVKMLYGIR